MSDSGVSGVQFADNTGFTIAGLHLETFPARLRGWLLRKPSDAMGAILLSPCNAVHFFGMRFALDVIFIDRAGAVIGHERNKLPGALPARQPGAWGVLEIPTAFCAQAWTPLRFVWTPTRLL